MDGAQAHGNRLGVAGVGLIGTSIALRAAELGWNVCGWDPNADHLMNARERGAIAQTRPSLAALARDADVIVLAGPPDAIVRDIEALAARPPSAALVMDVASVKVEAARAGSALRAFVATHPIAGSERSGPSAASARLFEGRVWTYDPSASPQSIALARRFIVAMGARPIAVASAEHDRIVALTSHLPQLVAVALGERLEGRVGDANVVALCGSGMRSMLRLGGSPWPVWRAILSANAPAVAQEVRRLADILLAFAGALEAGDSAALASDFEASARAVDRLARNGATLDTVSAATKDVHER